jgi:hypothetical protein
LVYKGKSLLVAGIEILLLVFPGITPLTAFLLIRILTMTLQILAEKLILLDPFEIGLHFLLCLFLHFRVFERPFSELDQPVHTFYKRLQVFLEKGGF